MKTPLLIGVTGGIGSGKSVVTRIFSILGVKTYDADSRAKWLVNNDPDIRKKIVDLLGQEAFSGKAYNREWVASRVFSNPELLNELNKIIHPAVAGDFNKWVQQNKEEKYLIKEAALLFEAGSYKELDKVILVSAPEKVRIRRVLQRDPQRKEEDIRQIISKQWPEENKVSMADFKIRNDNRDLILPQVLELHQAFSS